MRRRRIDQIGSDEAARDGAGSARRIAWACDLPGVRRLEWHEAPAPDGEFVRLPVPGLVVILNVGARGAWRVEARDGWRAQPAASVRGLTVRPTFGRDPGSGALGYVSLVLAPWAAPLYLGAPAAAFGPGLSDLALIDATWSALLARVASAGSTDDRRASVDALLRLLLRRRADMLGASLRRARALAEALERGHRVAAVAAAHGISPRRLHQWATATFGVAPGALAAIARFGRGVDALQPTSDARARAAWRAEHADQSHATRAFRRLTGLTPGAYAALQRGDRRTQFAVPLVVTGTL